MLQWGVSRETPHFYYQLMVAVKKRTGGVDKLAGPAYNTPTAGNLKKWLPSVVK